VTGHRDSFDHTGDGNLRLTDSIPDNLSFYVAIIEQTLNLITNFAGIVVSKGKRLFPVLDGEKDFAD
jgi:hypothetical protein